MYLLANISSASEELNLLDRKRAQILFVLAVLNARRGYKEVAKGYARECIKLLCSLGDKSYEECATSFVCVEGVALPEFLHEDVVRAQLKMLDVQVR